MTFLSKGLVNPHRAVIKTARYSYGQTIGALFLVLHYFLLIGCSPQNTSIGPSSVESGSKSPANGGGGGGGSSVGPDAFSFTDELNAALSAEVTSNAVTLTGFTGLVSAACVGCSQILRNGIPNGNTAAFLPGDTIALRVISASSPNAVKTAYVVVGSTTSGTWSVTASNNTPTAFSFTNQTGVFTSAPIASNTVTLAGTFSNVTATCGVGCSGISKNGATFVAGPVNGFNSGDTIAIKLQSSSSSNAATTATVTVGSTTSSVWSVTTTTDPCANSIPAVGTVCADGTLYVGLTPDGNVKMFTTKCDAGLLKGDGTCETDRAANNGVKKNWSSSVGTATGITGSITGRANTNSLYALIGDPRHGNFESVKYCYELVQNGHDDWYLPAIGELDMLYDGRLALGNFETLSGDPYWSATEDGPYCAWSQMFTIGNQASCIQGNPTKYQPFWVRCVRSEGAAAAPSANNGALGPAAFGFAATTNSALSTEVTSNTVTLTGLTSMVFAACVNCTHIIRNGVVNGNTSIFMPGDTIALQMMTAATPNTATYGYVVVGSTTSGTWAVTTSNNTPTAFSFTNQTGAFTNAPITSNTVTLAGTFSNVTATCGAGCTGISKNGASFVAGPVNGFNTGDTIAIKLQSSSSSNAATTATVTVGSTTSSMWSVTTTTDPCASSIPAVGTVCADGTLYAGLTPDGSVKMFTTKCDAGLLKIDGSCETNRAANTGAKKNWSSLATTVTGITNPFTGRANTYALYALIGNPNHGNFEAAKYCYELVQYGHDDWYLPAKDELNLLYDGRVALGNFETSTGDYYWSATEMSSLDGRQQRFIDGLQRIMNKSLAFWFRCVRSEGAPAAPSNNGALGPDAFGFAATANSALSTEVTSNTVTLTGLTSMVFAACVNCTHIIRNGVVNGNTSIFMPGDTIALQMMTAATPNTATYGYVVVGSTTSGTWAVTTSNNTPTAFSFTNQTGAFTNAPITSNTLTLAGTFSNVTATCGAGCTGISKNGASFVAGPVNGFNTGDTIAIKLTSSGTSNTATTATVTVGSTTSSVWSVTTTTDPCADSIPAVGTVCADGTLYAGLSPDGNVKMFTTKCDAGLLKGDGTCETDRVANAGVKKNWSSLNTTATGITNPSSGRANTSALYALIGDPNHGNFEAVKYCYELIQDGHDDWYLPAKDELDLIYDGRVALGNFETSSGDFYWSATENSNGYAWSQRFADGHQTYGYIKNYAFWFRCVRSEGAPAAPSNNGALGPDAFGFAATTNAALSTEVTSNTVTLTGLTSMVFAACVNCTHIIRNGVVNGNTSIFMPGDNIALQMMTAATPNTATYGYVVVGSTTSGTWAVTTSNNTPTAFSFTNQTGAFTNAPITSDTVTLAGTFSNVTATCGAGCTGISKNGATFVAGPVNGFNTGDTIAIKLTSSGTSNTATTATVIVGSTTSSVWSVTTTTDPCADSIPAVGTVCADGTLYAGLTPDGSVKMFTTKCDAGLLKGDGTCETDRAANTGVNKKWSTLNTAATGITNPSSGRANTSALYALIGDPNHGNFEAVKYCYELIQDGHDDWYLPAKDELDLMYDGRVALGNFETSVGDPYWSSTEVNANVAGSQRFTDGNQPSISKYFAVWVRCVRRD